MAKMPDAVEGNVTLEWLVKGVVALFRSHTTQFEKPDSIDGACVVHIDSPTSCEIKDMVSGGMDYLKMITGYRKVIKMLASPRYTRVKLEVFKDERHVIHLGRRKASICIKTQRF